MKRIQIIFLIFCCVQFFINCESSKKDLPFIERLQPVPRDSGFHMADYWVWGGSVIKVDSTYHLFASRWPKTNPFPQDYRQHSEIVRATSTRLVGPYTFQEVVIGERDSSFWDSNMAHNPTIHKIGDEYVLFYIGSDFTTMRQNSNNLLRCVGYAVAPEITGPWKRCDKPIIDDESNNPAVYVEKDGSIKLMFRDAELRIVMAEAPSYKGPFTIKNDNVWPNCKLEDFYLFKHNGLYNCICEDNVGGVSGHERWGVNLVSENGITGWTTHDPVVMYDHDITFDDGTALHCTRRERPQLFIDNGQVSALLTAVYDGDNSWCQPVLVSPLY